MPIINSDFCLANIIEYLFNRRRQEAEPQPAMEIVEEPVKKAKKPLPLVSPSLQHLKSARNQKWDTRPVKIPGGNMNRHGMYQLMHSRHSRPTFGIFWCDHCALAWINPCTTSQCGTCHVFITTTLFLPEITYKMVMTSLQEIRLAIEDNQRYRHAERRLD